MGRLFGSRVSVRLKLWKWLATGIRGSLKWLDPPKKEHNSGFAAGIAAGNGAGEKLATARETRDLDNGRNIDLIAPKPISPKASAEQIAIRKLLD